MILVDKKVKRVFFLVLFISFLVSFSSCLYRRKVFLISGQTMGTTYTIKIASTRVNTPALKIKIEKSLKKINKQMSTYILTSEISKVNDSLKNEHVKISPWFKKVLTYSLDLAKNTDGSYDPTLGPLVNLWGFGPGGYKKIPQKKEIQKALAVVGYQRLSLIKNRGEYFVKKDLDEVYVDLSSLAKGFGVDILSELLIKEGYKNYLVEIGGELKASGKKNKRIWKVAIEKPNSDLRILEMSFPLENMSIATSGNYRNFFLSGKKSYSHILNVKTGEPVENSLISVSVLNKECMKADALATALMSLGFKKAKEYALNNKLAAYFIFKGEDLELQTFKSPEFKVIMNMVK